MTLPGWSHVYSGKVRDLYENPDQPGRMLVVASDRVSAFDHVLEPGIPGKGELLTRLSLWWFGQLAGVPNHLVTELPTGAEAPPPNAMLVRRLDMHPIECVVRGYLAGGGWLEYEATQSVCGVALPTGLRNGDRLPQPIYTPAWKAPLGEHDENISFERTVELVGQATAAALRDASLDVFARASAIAESRGVILADTKFEFGVDSSGDLLLIDEALTPDSSRWCIEASYEERLAAGEEPESLDKEVVRRALAAAGYTGEGPIPELGDDVWADTAQRYVDAFERLTGLTFVPGTYPAGPRINAALAGLDID